MCVKINLYLISSFLPQSQGVLSLLSSLFSNFYSYWIMQARRLCWILVAPLSGTQKLLLITAAFLAYSRSKLYLWKCLFLYFFRMGWSKRDHLPRVLFDTQPFSGITSSSVSFVTQNSLCFDSRFLEVLFPLNFYYFFSLYLSHKKW